MEVKDKVPIGKGLLEQIAERSIYSKLTIEDIDKVVSDLSPSKPYGMGHLVILHNEQLINDFIKRHQEKLYDIPEEEVRKFILYEEGRGIICNIRIRRDA